ncbi:IS30 family transposase [Dolosigranulum pigrum]|nr:IS30 family transposase [Dolosigranulum pigrum]QTJ56989.1 IS30 family transposase [Dolosigranulum pigrum]
MQEGKHLKKAIFSVNLIVSTLIQKGQRNMTQVKCTKLKPKGKHLDEDDREYLEKMARQNCQLPKNKRLTQADMADELGVHPSIISRELRRGQVTQKDPLWREYTIYSASAVQEKIDKGKTNKGPDSEFSPGDSVLKAIETIIISQKYSPYAALQHLKKGDKFTHDQLPCLRTIYHYINADKFEKLTQDHLPREGQTQRRTYHHVKKRKKVVPPNRLIKHRSESINNREEDGHWEMDCVESGKGHSKTCLLTLVERKTRKSIIRKMTSQTQVQVLKQLDELEDSLGTERFKQQFKSITVDNGSEFLDYETLEGTVKSRENKRTHLFYCQPYSSYERGSNEQMHTLLRRFIPKGSDISQWSLNEIKEIENTINDYPRLLFDGLSANEKFEAFQEAIAS